MRARSWSSHGCKEIHSSACQWRRALFFEHGIWIRSSWKRASVRWAQGVLLFWRPWLQLRQSIGITTKLTSAAMSELETLPTQVVREPDASEALRSFRLCYWTRSYICHAPRAASLTACILHDVLNWMQGDQMAERQISLNAFQSSSLASAWNRPESKSSGAVSFEASFFVQLLYCNLFVFVVPSTRVCQFYRVRYAFHDSLGSRSLLLRLVDKCFLTAAQRLLPQLLGALKGHDSVNVLWRKITS